MLGYVSVEIEDAMKVSLEASLMDRVHGGEQLMGLNSDAEKQLDSRITSPGATREQLDGDVGSNEEEWGIRNGKEVQKSLDIVGGK